MSERTLPHDPYISAVVTALTAAGLEPDDYWTSDAETNPYDEGPDAGLTTMLNAVITWDADEEADQDGLLLLWDHPAEQWQYAWPRPEGGNTEPEFIARLGRFSHPNAVAATARALLVGEPQPEGHAPYWHEADAIRAAITRWENS